MRWLRAIRSRVELETLVLLVLLAGAAWAFGALAGEVLEGDTRALDRAILLALRSPGDPSDPRGPVWLEELGRDYTALGGVGVLCLLTAAAATFLWLRGNGRSALFLLVAIAGGMATSQLLKLGFARPRPELVPHLARVYTSSFPSGHSMMSAVTYLTLAAMLARHERRRRVRAFLLACALFLTVLVGASRVYLGVHWPTDVLAGWTAGAAWALGCVLVARWLERRREIEPEAPEQRP